MARVCTGNEMFSLASAPVSVYPVTMGGWCLLTAASTHTLMAITDGTTDNYWAIQIWADDSVLCQINETAGAINAVAPAGLASDVWGNITYVAANSTSHVCWLNGVAGTPVTTDRTPTGLNKITIGATNIAATWAISGSLFWSYVYNTDLSDSQVQELAIDRKCPLRVARDNIKHFSPFWADEDYDVVGGNRLTVDGSPTVGPNPPEYGACHHPWTWPMGLWWPGLGRRRRREEALRRRLRT